MNKWVGKQLGDYRIDEPLLINKPGLTFKATHIKTGRVVVLKLLSPDFIQPQDTAYARFRREAEILKDLVHPHIIHFIEYAEQDDVPFLVTEYMPGGTLREYLTNSLEGLDIDEVFQLFMDIADAIDYAHQRGIIHRDLKPENIVLQDTENRVYPYIADFGIALIVGRTRHTRTDADWPLGTAAYVPPEMYEQSDPTPQSDIYALGVMLYEALEGHPAFPLNATQQAIMNAKLDKPVPYGKNIKQRTNSRVAKTIQRAMHKNPKKRHNSASELMEAIEQAYKSGTEEELVRIDRFRNLVIGLGLLFATLLAPLIPRLFPGDGSQSTPESRNTQIPTQILIVPTYTLTLSSPPTSTDTPNEPTHTLSSINTPTETATRNPTSTLTIPLSTHTPETIVTSTHQSSSTARCIITAIVIVNGANIRFRAGTDNVILKSVPKGTQLQAIGRTRDNSWWQVVYEVGKTGWVMKNLAEPMNNCDLPITGDDPKNASPVPTLIRNTELPVTPDTGQATSHPGSSNPSPSEATAQPPVIPPTQPPTFQCNQAWIDAFTAYYNNPQPPPPSYLDLNGDGKVDGVDYTICLNNWGG